MAVYSYTRTQGAFGHGLATIDSDKGLNSFEYEDLGEFNGKHYIYTLATAKRSLLNQTISILQKTLFQKIY